MSHVHIVTLSFSAALSWVEAQLCAFEITLASFCSGLFPTTFQQFLTTLGCLWKSGPPWSPRWIICHSLPTPWIWRWNFWLSNGWLSPDVPCLINSPVHVLFKSMQCWRNVLHVTVLCEQLLPSSIHMTECWCSLIQENNISLYFVQVIRRRMSGLEHELTERKRLWDEAYCTK